jgi:putative tributyrin esterase
MSKTLRTLGSAFLGLLAFLALSNGAFRNRQKLRQPQPPVANAPASPTASPISPAGAADKIADHQSLRAASLSGAELPYRIFVPNGYQTSIRRCPVLYLLHGLSGNENDWWERSRLAEYLAKYRLIVVTPGVGDSWYANSASDPKARYEDVIVRDLIPFIDAHYRTVATREGRAIAGLSMGGLAAMKFALHFPEMFAFAGSFSGAFDVPRTTRLGKTPGPKMLKDLQVIFGDAKSPVRRENDVFWLLDQVKDKDTLPYLYVSTGTSDPLPQVSESNPRFGAALRKRDLKFEYNERPGTHDWHFWDSEINLMLGKMCVFMHEICS